MELLYYVREDDTILGSMESDRAHAEGVLHRSGLVFLVRSDGRVLIQHRSPSKKTFPDRFDCSCAFHVAFGETYEEAAARELLEETGVSANLQLLGKFVHHDPPEHQVVAAFLCRSESGIRIDEAESSGFDFLTKADVDRLVALGNVTPWLRDGWSLARGEI